MLVAALGVTLVGFILLVIALVTSSVPLAWACIVICLVGFGLLIADVLGVRKGAKAPAENSAGAPAPVVEAQVPEAAAAEADAPEAYAPEAYAPEAFGSEADAYKPPVQDVVESDPAVDSDPAVESDAVASAEVEGAAVQESDKDR